MHFELGGKNPVIVFDDADLERAADAAVFMIYSLNGERCTSSSRLLVQDRIYEEFTAAVANEAKRIKVGHPLDPATVIGPLIHPVHEKKVLEYLDLAGAKARRSRPAAARSTARAAAAMSRRRCSPARITACASRRKKFSGRC